MAVGMALGCGPSVGPTTGGGAGTGGTSGGGSSEGSSGESWVEPPMPEDCGDAVLADGWLHISADEYDERDKLDGVAVIDGDLVIRRSELTNLDLLRCIREITGTLHIYDNDALVDVSGLWWVERLGGDLIVADNDALVEFDALAKVRETEREQPEPSKTVNHGIVFIRNASLERIRGLAELERITGDLVLRSNPALVSLEGLGSLREVGYALAVNHNASLCPPTVDAIRDGLAASPPRGVSALGNGDGCSPPWPDDVEPEDECSQARQDCPGGMRCILDEVDNFTVWACRPAAEQPRRVGESCSFEEDWWPWVDDCERGALCVDALNSEVGGTCVEHYALGYNNPACSDPFEFGYRDAWYRVCLAGCDPLQQNCQAGFQCVWNPENAFREGFVCVRDTGGPGEGERCYLERCATGLECWYIEERSADGYSGTCVPYCSLATPECPQGLSCQARYEPEQAPPGWDDVGLCR